MIDEISAIPEEGITHQEGKVEFVITVQMQHAAYQSLAQLFSSNISHAQIVILDDTK